MDFLTLHASTMQMFPATVLGPLAMHHAYYTRSSSHCTQRSGKAAGFWVDRIDMDTHTQQQGYGTAAHKPERARFNFIWRLENHSLPRKGCSWCFAPEAQRRTRVRFGTPTQHPNHHPRSSTCTLLRHFLSFPVYVHCYWLQNVCERARSLSLSLSLSISLA